jgi:MOSC domain-containing protein YiiM
MAAESTVGTAGRLPEATRPPRHEATIGSAALMTHLHGTLVSLRIGQPQTLTDTSGVDRLEPVWTTAIFKQPVSGAIWLGPTGLEGDGHGDPSVHGGPHQALLLYAATHYADWRSSLARPDLSYGAFGENVTVDGLDETTVCLGDQFTIGTGPALVEVSQPRRPCWKLSRRHGVADLAQQVQRNGRGGWYVRVLQPGHIAAGDSLTLAARPYSEWPIARVNDIMYRREDDPASRAALAACPAISPRWRNVLTGAGPDRV